MTDDNFETATPAPGISGVSREEQKAELDRLGVSPEARQMTEDLYGLIDSLDQPKRAILVGELLVRVESTIETIIQNPEAMMGLASMLHGLVGMAGYANEKSREERNETSTGDKGVSAVIEAYRALTRKVVEESMTPEQTAKAERVSALVQSGASLGEALRAVGDSGFAEAADAPQARGGVTPGYGQYL